MGVDGCGFFYSLSMDDGQGRKPRVGEDVIRRDTRGSGDSFEDKNVLFFFLMIDPDWVLVSRLYDRF